ncbi:molybdopterin-guanine dinucleotide biosynthesis protein B [Alkalihalophilus sp. As8PL]|uniref:Molybdopterin-guanine dinucleotide biosynthesis protein B n=1 Tax=Alkalihalophilus sp. As8PL TaxID=3237103 RepID=A0AB39BVK5_9BACI
MEQYCPVLQVVGYQNSGKTTLMEILIQRCSKAGKRVATIKHHGHHTPQKQESNLKDSERHQQAGAEVTAVEGGGSLQIHIKNQSWSLDQMVSLYKSFSPDLILVEGFKKEAYPKVVLLRDEKDLSLLHEASDIICAITWEKELKVREVDYPIYHLDDAVSYSEFILKKLSDDDD